jgi:iron-sulfur cluster assembly accessory protein
MNKIKDLIKITPSAIKKINEINKLYNKEYLKIGIKSGGCSGFQYFIEPCDEKPEKIDEIIKMDNIKIKLCGYSLFKIMGTEIDWEESIMGEKFIFNNPNAEFKCGCGKSFN